MKATHVSALEDRALYNEYRRRLDARSILTHYGARNCTEQAGGDGTTEIVHSCLLDAVEPHHRNGDANPSACVNVERGQYICYAIGWGGDLLHLIQKLENKESITLALPVISSLMTGATLSQTGFTDELNRLFAKPTFSYDPPAYALSMLDPWAFCHPYMTEERGVSPEAQSLLKIGYDERENRIVFPHIFDGKLVGFQKRAIPHRPGLWPGTENQMPKYRSSSGFPKAETLYNYDVAKSSPHVTVVESPMSVAKAHSLGLPYTVATFGAKVTDHQIALLRNFSRVTVWFDNDGAGHTGERKLVEALYRHTDVRVVTPDDRDLGDHHDPREVACTIVGARPAVLALADYDKERTYAQRRPRY